MQKNNNKKENKMYVFNYKQACNMGILHKEGKQMTLLLLCENSLSKYLLITGV